MIPNLTDARIGVIGLGYAGLPLAVSFAGKGSLAKVRELAPEVSAFLDSVKQQEEDAP